MTQTFVLDASAAIAWASPDEKPSAAMNKAVTGGGAVVPALWTYEVHNVLLSLKRRKRLNEEDWQAASTGLAVISIEIESPVKLRVETEVVRLAEQYGLTLYDAAYLEVALRRRLPLATLDAELIAAAKKAKVKLI